MFNVCLILELIGAYRVANGGAAPITFIFYRTMDREADMLDVTDSNVGELEFCKKALKDLAPKA